MLLQHALNHEKVRLVSPWEVHPFHYQICQERKGDVSNETQLKTQNTSIPLQTPMKDIQTQLDMS